MGTEAPERNPEREALFQLGRAHDYSARAAGWMLVSLQVGATTVFDPGPPSGRSAAPTSAVVEGRQSAIALLQKIVAAEDVIAVARTVATELDRQAHSPHRVVKSAGGGVSFYFFGGEVLPDGSHQRYASIEADEDGALTAVYKDRASANAEIFEIPTDMDLGEAVRRVASFVQS